MTVLYECLILRRLAEICRIEPSVGDFDLEQRRESSFEQSLVTLIEVDFEYGPIMSIVDISLLQSVP